MRKSVLGVFTLLSLVSAVHADTTYDLSTARLVITGQGHARLESDSGAWPETPAPVVQLGSSGNLLPESITATPDRLTAAFPGGALLEYAVRPGHGFVVFELTRLEAPADASRLTLFSLAAPPDAQLVDTLNAARTSTHTAALQAATVNVHAFADAGSHTLNVETLAQHGLQPARFGLVISPTETFFDVMEAFEPAAGLPSPRPGDAWNKRSPWAKRSYLFITNFSESQCDTVLDMLRRGGFGMLLIGQESWANGTGHYDINTAHFPRGLDSLRDTIRRFKEAGVTTGLHFLSASVYPPDPYITPVPDPRLVKNATAELAADIDAKADLVPTTTAPEAFPAKDGGYLADGSLLQIGNEILRYTERKTDEPFGFTGCERAIHGTEAAGHAQGDTIHHLRQSYGYCLYDMDTTLIDEVSANFARVANACDIDMIYFDGSEALQGDHWYYNAKMHQAFFEKLAKKDILLQASSFSHYSWHILSRSASADGHGDIKGYLDERAAWFDTFTRNGMPLDIGWYYGYDPSATPDLFEYVLAASIGYDSSMSFQVSVSTASAHPFINEILDLIGRYEKLRLSGRVSPEMRARLRIVPELCGTKPEDQTELRHLRREYRLLDEAGTQAFQRVVYAPWHDISPGDDTSAVMQYNVEQGPATLGFQLHVPQGPPMAPGPAYRAADALVLETFDDLAAYAHQATLPGVTQQVTISPDGKESSCAVFSAESTLDDASGWTFFGKSFPSPLDLSWHRAIGFWMRGDGKRGLFKVQLLDGTNAADFYIENDYTGWRYQQLVRPQPDVIDYTHVTTLNFYYNGLPAKTAVACAVYDVKALRVAENTEIVNPWVEVNGRRLAWVGKVMGGQYLFLWPGEPVRLYGPASASPETGTEPADTLELPQGAHETRFGCENLVAPVRVRITLQPPERHIL